MCSPAPAAAPTSQSITQTTIPDYAKPYVETMLGQQQALGNTPYTAFPGGIDKQIAGFTPLQQQSQSGIARLQMPGQFGQASNATNTAMNNALGIQYTPNSYTADRVTGDRAIAAQLGAAPQVTGSQFQGPGDVGYRDVNALGLRQLSMQAANDITTGDFTSPGVASQYMNPYLQQSLNPQIAEAQRQGAIQQSQIGAQATQAGAYGGGRQAIQQAEAQRNMGTNIANIVGQGYNTAFGQAQGQFNTQQQQQLTAQQANQAVQQQANLQNLSSGLQTQGLGAQTGLQAQQSNQQAGIQTGQFNAGMDYNTSLQNAQMRQQANLANQGVSGQFGLRQGDFNQTANTQASTQAQQANLANQSANQQAAQLAAQQQQFGANYGIQGLQTGMQGAVNLSNIGNQSLGAQQNILASQGAAGAQQQAQEQARMTQSMRNFDQQVAYPQQQLNNMSNILRGVPLRGTGTESTYQAQPTALNQLAGLGTLAYGVSRIAKGGKIKEKQRPAGLAELALSRMG